MLCSVGFASPPDWLKSYDCLSQGEKMRVDIARALCLDSELVVFDEFTSVVDREIAKVSAYAISKAVRRSKKQFIAVTCHYDVVDWLDPDWVFCTDTMEFSRKKECGRPLNSTFIGAAKSLADVSAISLSKQRPTSNCTMLHRRLQRQTYSLHSGCTHSK